MLVPCFISCISIMNDDTTFYIDVLRSLPDAQYLELHSVTLSISQLVPISGVFHTVLFVLKPWYSPDIHWDKLCFHCETLCN